MSLKSYYSDDILSRRRYHRTIHACVPVSPGSGQGQAGLSWVGSYLLLHVLGLLIESMRYPGNILLLMVTDEQKYANSLLG